MENMKKKKGLILGASIGNCVHVAGVAHFLDLAEREGYETMFLGPAVSVEHLFQAITLYRPRLVAIGYRLTPDNVIPLLDEIAARRKRLSFPVTWAFGGTKPVADCARKYGFFAFVSDGYDDITDSLRFLRGEDTADGRAPDADTLLERIRQNAPYPLLRHHFGRPSVEETVEGVRKIAEARVLDVISLGPDQNAQQFFFHPEKMNHRYDGAGGVPLRKAEDLIRIKQAADAGNHPLLRCYSGTEDVFACGKLLLDTIDNAWAAIPLCWYNEMDGRSTRTLETSMREAQALIRWHAERGIPVELNEPHHWGLRDAHDVIPVAMAYISAYDAKRLGVHDYVAQYMFNNPSGLSFSMDLAKILAMVELTETLADDTFHIYRETRAGLGLFHPDPAVAKGQLASATFLQMAIHPHIVHVVGFCEADHAARAEEVIESCRIVRGVIRGVLNDTFSITQDVAIQARKEELLQEARYLLSFLREQYAWSDDPLANPEVLCDAVRKGYLDAVHIIHGGKFQGDLKTRLVHGKCLAVSPETGAPQTERERLARLAARARERERSAHVG